MSDVLFFLLPHVPSAVVGGFVAWAVPVLIPKDRAALAAARSAR